MNGGTVTKMRPKVVEPIERVMLTPAMATELLEKNTNNRPVYDMHVHRIAAQIKTGKWKFNGDTIKVSETNDVLDGQHRCWAAIEANTPIETVIVRGIKRDAFTTIDTVRRLRSGADTIALSGTTRYRNVIASALIWLLRWQRGYLPDIKKPQNKIENSDIEVAFVEHPQIMRAVERAMKVNRLANPSIIAFLYYVLSNRDQELAERMVTTLEDPSRVAISDPFFRLRTYFTAEHHKRKEPVLTIALAIKAANAAHHGKKVEILNWKNQGKVAEKFPTLDF